MQINRGGMPTHILFEINLAPSPSPGQVTFVEAGNIFS